MKQAVLPILIAATLAGSPAFASDEPVVIIPERNAPAFAEFGNYWRQWAQDFSSDLRHEMGTWISPRMGSKVVKGAPYSAEVVTETRQMLPDGNDISRRKNGVVYRDGEGRTRQETGPEGKERTVFINDPVAGAHYVLTPGSKRATATTAPAPRAMTYRTDTKEKSIIRSGGSEIRIEDGKVFVDGKQVVGADGRIEVNKGGKSIVVDGGKVTIDGKPVEAMGNRHVTVHRTRTEDGKQQEEVVVRVVRSGDGADAMVTPVPPAPPVAPVAPVPPTPPAPPALPGINTMRFESTARLGKGVTTSLGVKEFDGVKAEGKSTTWTIPAGQIGNRNPIMVMSETWYSPELQVTVYSRHHDPRTGESVYRLANIRRSEPSADLFKVPADYKVRGRAPKAPQG